MTNRSLGADLVRVLAIYLVIVTHSSVLPEKISLHTFDVRIITYIFAITCVPLFVLLSGYLLLGKNESYSVFFKKRFSRLMYPWITWTVIYTVMLIYTKHLHSFSEIFRAFITQFESFWFLPMIAGLYLFTPALRIFVAHAKKHDLWLVLLLWFFFVCLFPYTKSSLAFPRQVDDGLVRQLVNFSGYFLLGFLLPSVKLSKSWFSAIGAICIGVFWTIISIYSASLANGGVLVKDFYSYVAPGIVLVSIGLFISLMLLGSTLEKSVSNTFKNITTLVSIFALAIYFLHFFVQLALGKFIVEGNTSPFFPLDNYVNAGIVFVIAFVVLFGFYKIPLLKKLMF